MTSTEAHPVPDGIERLSWSQIRARFPDEWVVIADTEWVTDTDFDFTSAIVVAHHRHHKDTSPAVKSAFEQFDEVGCFWTGEIRRPMPWFVVP